MSYSSADAAIVQAATWTVAVTAGYLVLAVVVAAARARTRVSRVVVAAAGLAVALAGGGVALAAPGDGGSSHPRVSVDWPTDRDPAPTHAVVVHHGDCLWTIAARRLARPTPVRVAAAWPRWWRANQHVVGRNPDVIHPGQRLRPPVTTRSRS